MNLQTNEMSFLIQGCMYLFKKMNFYYAPDGFLYPYHPYLPPMMSPYYGMEEREPSFYNILENPPMENHVPMISESNTP